MTKTFAAERFRLNLVDWAQELTDPNAGVGSPAAIGSLWDQAGPSVPTELFLKVRAADTGWVRLDSTYNVKSFGAVGDGVTNDGPAIQAATDACNAAGGGIVYFPPVNVVAGQFYRLRKPASNLGSIMLDNYHNITFMGDGYASRVEMFDDSGNVQWNGFQLFNGTSRIVFRNFQISGVGISNTVTNGNQFICIAGNATDANTGTGHVDVLGMFWGDNNGIFGNRVTCGGDDLAHSVDNVRYSYNLGDYATALRIFWATMAAGNGGGGFSSNIEANFNWCGGWRTNINGNALRNDIAAGEIRGGLFNVVGNIANGLAGVGVGSAYIASHGTIAWSIVATKGAIAVGARGAIVRGNVVTTSTGIPAISASSQSEIGSCIVGNVSVRDDAVATEGISTALSIVPVLVADNIAQISPLLAATAIQARSTIGMACTGNIAIQTANNNNVGIGIANSAPANVSIDNSTLVGNLVLAVGANSLQVGLAISTSGAGVQRNCQTSFNMTSKALNGIQHSSGAGAWAEWRGVNDNNVIGATTQTVILPTTNVGVTHEGSAGPGTQFALNGVTPTGNVSAPQGSMANNTTGGPATTVFYKESGVGVSGGTAGWFGVGAFELTFGTLACTTATANRFFAPGLGLPVEGTVEIFWAAPRAGIVRNMRIKCIAGTGGTSNTFAIRKNGVDTSLQAGVANTATTGSSGLTFTIVAGDRISVRVSKGAVPTLPQTLVAVGFEII